MYVCTLHVVQMQLDELSPVINTVKVTLHKYLCHTYLHAYCICSSPQPVMSQPYPVPIPLPLPKSRPLPDSRGIPDTLNLFFFGEQAFYLHHWEIGCNFELRLEHVAIWHIFLHRYFIIPSY